MELGWGVGGWVFWGFLLVFSLFNKLIYLFFPSTATFPLIQCQYVQRIC